MSKAPRRPAYVRCGDKRKITMAVFATVVACLRHWRELPDVWRETGRPAG